MPNQKGIRPNVVLIICDDIGFGDLSCNGSTMIKTPNLDLVAEKGARLTAMYGGGPIWEISQTVDRCVSDSIATSDFLTAMTWSQ